MQERTMVVNGQGKISVPPDYIVVNMSLNTVREQYNDAIEAAGRGLNELRECLREVGFEKEEIKTTDFQVNTVYENIKTDAGDFKRVFKGYEVINKLRLEFSENPVLLGRVLNRIATCKSKPEFSISYEVKDKEMMEKRLLEEAIRDAQWKAEIMAETAKVKLNRIIKIEGGQIFIENINGRIAFAKASNTSIDLEPEYISGEASVLIVWKIDE